MKHIAQTLTIAIGAGALVLATAGFTGAQETTPNRNDRQDQTQPRKAVSNGQGQGTQKQTVSARRLGPGDGTGKQGLRPQDGSGNGSPGRQRASSIVVKDRGGTNGEASKAGKGSAGSRGSGQGTMTRSRARSANAAAARTCYGSGARSRRATGGSRGSGGGRR